MMPRELLPRSGYGEGLPGWAASSLPSPDPTLPHRVPLCTLQGLQRRATPHPSELKVMKRGVEERRGEAYSWKPESRLPSPLEEVPVGTCTVPKGHQPGRLAPLGSSGCLVILGVGL